MGNIKISTRYGELNIAPSQVITFPRGIPGFEGSTRWTLFHEVDDKGEWVNGVVVHLQSLDDGDASLALTDPHMFGFSHDLVLSDSEVAELKLEDPDDIMVLTTVSAKNGNGAAAGGHHRLSDSIYTNISAPILINTKSRIGMQKILVGRESRIGFGGAFFDARSPYTQVL